MDHKILDRGTYAEIDRNALKENCKNLRAHLGDDRFFCPMVKANAYGHGDVLVAKALEEVGVSHMGVGFLEEAIPLREAGVRCDILVFGIFQEYCLPLIESLHLTPVVSQMRQLEFLERDLKSPIKIHLKFNTGMNRLGFSVEQVKEVKSFLEKSKKLQVEGVCSHFKCGEDLENASGESRKQIDAYKPVLAKFSDPSIQHHFYNSSSLLLHKQCEDLKKLNFGARPGIALYGYPPVQCDIELQPVMSLRSKVVHFQDLERGESVSYGGVWTADKKTRLAVVPIGYADGYLRLLSNQTEVLIGGARVPIIGRVCMDYIMIDVGALPFEVKLGDPITLFGRDGEALLLAEELADRAQTISYEILTSVGERVPRIFLDT